MCEAPSETQVVVSYAVDLKKFRADPLQRVRGQSASHHVRSETWKNSEFFLCIEESGGFGEIPSSSTDWPWAKHRAKRGASRQFYCS